MAGNRLPTSRWVTPWVNQRSSGSGRTSRRPASGGQPPVGSPGGATRDRTARHRPLLARSPTRWSSRYPGWTLDRRHWADDPAKASSVVPRSTACDRSSSSPTRVIQAGRRARGARSSRRGHGLPRAGHPRPPDRAAVAGPGDGRDRGRHHHPPDQALRVEQRPAPSGGRSRRTSPASTSSPTAASMSPSAPAGTDPSTTPSASRSSPPRSVRRGSRRPSPSSRAVSPTVRSASPASTTRSPRTTPSRSRSSDRIRRS